MGKHQLYGEYVEEMRKIADLRYSSAILQWDQETYMPVKGARYRGQQIASITELSHRFFTASTFGDLLRKLLDDGTLSFVQRKNAEQSYEDFERQAKLPAQFVRKMSETINTCFHSWIEARRKNDFRIFEPMLSKLITLKIQEAEYIGYQNNRYDVLMQEFDKSLDVRTVDKLFSDLQPAIKSILSKIEKQPVPDNAFLKQYFEKNKQWDFGMQLLKNMHFDFERGRQDISEHPFTTNFSAEDVRITTRIDEHDLANMTWSCIHEGGHALYEQGLPPEEYGLPSGEYCSLSIHESQSRLWENHIGRSLSYWEFHFPDLQKIFPDQLRNISPAEFFRAINIVQPSLIRTEADELTYHFHVMIRYEIEKKIINEEIKAKDIPAYWNELYGKGLGITPLDDLTGCLQDVHWSHGSFGYFATYSIGSLYSAQFYQEIHKKNPEVESDLQQGNSLSVWNWLRQNIYPAGKTLTSEELCEKVTGEKLNSRHFIKYANQKFGKLYGL